MLVYSDMMVTKYYINTMLGIVSCTFDVPFKIGVYRKVFHLALFTLHILALIEYRVRNSQMSRKRSNSHMDNCTNENSLKEEAALITT
jgi:hypothetical protein